MPAKVGESVIRLLASCCEETRLKALMLNHWAAVLAALESGMSLALPVSSTSPKAIGGPLW